jgi:hypothetical protein
VVAAAAAAVDIHWMGVHHEKLLRMLLLAWSNVVLEALKTGGGRVKRLR